MVAGKRKAEKGGGRVKRKGYVAAIARRRPGVGWCVRA